MQDSVGRYIGVVAQGPNAGDIARPLHPVDWNDAQQIFLNYARTLGIVGGNGAADKAGELLRPHGFTSNLPNFVGVSSAFSSAAFAEGNIYMVAGLPVYLGPGTSNQFAWDETASSTTDFIHRKAATISGAVITDPTLCLKTNVLQAGTGRAGARTVKFLMNDGAWSAAFTVSSNTTSTITLTTSPSLGTVGATILASGATYRIETATPSSSVTDYAWLDCWIEEIAADTTASDPFVDSTLNLNFQGTPLETTRRWQLRSAIFIEHNSVGSGSNYIDATGSATFTSNTPPTFYYTDTAGVRHWVTAVAAYDRHSTDAGTVTNSYVKDLRPLTGRAHEYSTDIVAKNGGGNGIISGLTATRGGGSPYTYSLAVGTFALNGRLYTLGAGIDATGPTDGLAATWATTGSVVGEGPFYAFIDQYGRPRVSASAPGASDIPLDKFSATAGVLNAFTAGVNYENQRQYCRPLANVLQPGSDDRFREYLRLQASGLATPQENAGVELYDKAGVYSGSLDHDDATPKTIRLQSANAYSLELVGAGTSGGNPAKLTLSGATGSGTLDAPGGMTFKADSGDYDASGANGPTSWKFNEVQADSVVAPGVAFGTVGGGAAASTGSVYVPGARALLNHWKLTNQTAGFDIVADRVTISPFGAYCLHANFRLGAGARSENNAMFCLPLDLPYGTEVTAASVWWQNDLVDATYALEFKAAFAYRDDFATPMVIDATTATIGWTIPGAGTAQSVALTNVPLTIDKARHYVLVWNTGTYTVGGSPDDSEVVSFLGVKLDISCVGAGTGTGHAHPVLGFVP